MTDAVPLQGARDVATVVRIFRRIYETQEANEDFAHRRACHELDDLVLDL